MFSVGALPTSICSRFIEDKLMSKKIKVATMTAWFLLPMNNTQFLYSSWYFVAANVMGEYAKFFIWSLGFNLVPLGCLFLNVKY